MQAMAGAGQWLSEARRVMKALFMTTFLLCVSRLAFGEFDGFTDHDTHGDGSDGLGFCQFEGFADEVAVVDKGLLG